MYCSICRTISNFLLLLVIIPCAITTNSACSRSASRIVRNVFNEEVLPMYIEHEVPLPSHCPFQAQHDMYAVQEMNKYSDTPSRWVCGFCGKSFYDERYLDKHYDTRHQDKLATAEQMCLADYCDVFRCDIIMGKVLPNFWDFAMCKESDVVKLLNRCESLMTSCIPKTVNKTLESQLQDRFRRGVCSYLTCERLWETADTETPKRKTVLYIIASVTVMFGLFVYYFVAYTHFYTNESLYNGVQKKRERRRELEQRRSENLRHRIAMMSANSQQPMF